MRTHTSYPEYVEFKDKAEEYTKKADTQDEFIKGLGKLDRILDLLQRASQVEMKYLYLET